MLSQSQPGQSTYLTSRIPLILCILPSPVQGQTACGSKLPANDLFPRSSVNDPEKEESVPLQTLPREAGRAFSSHPSLETPASRVGCHGNDRLCIFQHFGTPFFAFGA
ncbi:hypothetical protein AVEN_48798-1 [Araneus ventricosus]|uniref:Uncharacterized protein n=1 Tax=Araneus ventricosus TaxID=182803 RepID=A0A4Y2II71_ARAVE|nr:hypothetical protein AVEN_48798-1 [Araneus ventricosus]